MDENGLLNLIVFKHAFRDMFVFLMILWFRNLRFRDGSVSPRRAATGFFGGRNNGSGCFRIAGAANPQSTSPTLGVVFTRIWRFPKMGVPGYP